jgi:hypothetical protein
VPVALTRSRASVTGVPVALTRSRASETREPVALTDERIDDVGARMPTMRAVLPEMRARLPETEHPIPKTDVRTARMAMSLRVAGPPTEMTELGVCLSLAVYFMPEARGVHAAR